MLKQIDAWPRWIVVITGGALFTGLLTYAIWAASGVQFFLSSFFDGPGMLVLVGLPAVELLCSILAFRGFRSGEPLRRGWFLIACGSLCHLVGALGSQMLGRHSWLNPLVWIGWPGDLEPLRQLGVAIGGPLWIALLAAGLWWVVRVYRRAGLWARLKWMDWLALALTAGFAGLELAQVVQAVYAGKQVTFLEMAALVSNPLLALLTLEALVIRRSVMAMGHGLVARCWGAFVAGILLTFLGNVGVWATNSGHVHMPLAGLFWYIWFPATAAFALGPLYQAIAVRRVEHSTRVLARPWAYPSRLRPTGTAPRNA